MSKEQTKWESDIEGKPYSFLYEKEKGHHVITVNEQLTKIKPSFKSMILGFDEPFAFDGFKARLVVKGKLPDVAVNGILLQSQKPYVMTPWWVMLFGLPLLALLVAGGAIGGGLGAIGFMICVAISKRKLPSIVKIILCIVVVALFWLIYSVIALV